MYPLTKSTCHVEDAHHLLTMTDECVEHFCGFRGLFGIYLDLLVCSPLVHLGCYPNNTALAGPYDNNLRP